MIDIKFLRENPEIVKENIRKKFQDEKLPLVDEVIALDLESRKTQTEADELRAKANKTTLDRMWILRKHISDMNAVEAMNTIHDRMQQTLNNEEFLLSMNS